MTSLKRKLMSKINGYAAVKKRLQQGQGDTDRDRDRDTDRDTERDKDRDTDRKRNTDRGRDIERDRDTERDRERDEDTDRGRDKDTDRDRDTERDGDTDRDRDRNTERGRDTVRHRGRDADRDTDSDTARGRDTDRGRNRDRDTDRDRNTARDRPRGEDPDPTCSQYFPSKSNHGARLRLDFFNQPCVDLAQALLGKVLVRRHSDGTELRGRVVETEAYLGGEDKASHSAGGRRTQRNAAMFMKPGTIYVYPIYGIYLCMNISSQGEGAAVLLRSLEPLQGQDVMRTLRASKRKEGAKVVKDKELSNGPSKLCQALDVQRCFDRRDLASNADVWLETDSDWVTPEADVVSAPRIGVESHGEWATKPLRFYLRGHWCVSVVDRVAESKQ